MADLGFLDDPADYLGMLDGQSLRAARVVLDIGFHGGGFAAPAEVGGGEWDVRKGVDLPALARREFGRPGFLRLELDRYLGWPGQAPSYKIGEPALAPPPPAAARRREGQAGGDAFDLKAPFHRTALDIGSLGLDVLREALVG